MGSEMCIRDSKDTDQRMQTAKEMGTNHVSFQIVNSSPSIIHRDFEKEITTVNATALNGEWVEYHNAAPDERKYDYSIVVKLQFIEVSPEHSREKHSDHEKEIEDGTQYVFDADGNVMKDSLGNDIKVPKYVKVKCHLVEVNQEKIATIGGTVDYLDNETKSLMETVPVRADGVFKHTAYIIEGDQRALPKELKRKTKFGNKLRPFPTDHELLLNASLVLKDIVAGALRDHEHLVNR